MFRLPTAATVFPPVGWNSVFLLLLCSSSRTLLGGGGIRAFAPRSQPSLLIDRRCQNQSQTRSWSSSPSPSFSRSPVVPLMANTHTAANDFLSALSDAASDALGRPVTLERTTGAGAAGGGGASTSAVTDVATGVRYFCKSASHQQRDMLQAEYLGVQAMAASQTIRVPTPIAFGTFATQAFVLFEYLEFTGGGSQYELGQQLALMHRSFSPDGAFGFQIDNTIGATPQPNSWREDWADFWEEHRLDHMLKLTGNAGLTPDQVEALRLKTRELLSHEPDPSLIHGDLWGGNKGFCKQDDKTVPCIFDPATYYGDREADVAMTYVFGGFTNDFYDGYESEWPLPEGHEQRRTVYNLYHILNHDVLFGGFYINQARGMIDTIMKA